MSKKGENIFKRKDGRYEARYVKERDDLGKIIKYGFVYGKSYMEAKMKRERIIKTNLDENKLYNNYLDKEINNWLKTKILIKESSYYNYYSIIYSKIIPYFKKYKLNKINDNIIIDYIKYLKEQNLSSKRIKDILLVLKQFLDYKNIKIKIDFPKVTYKKIITLDNNEINIIEKTAKKSKDIKVFAILLVLYTGLRIGELCALQWKDIDLENNVIHVSKTLIRIKNKDYNSRNKTKIIIDRPKTQCSIRDIPINQTILPYLKKFKKDNNFYLLTGNNNYITTMNYYIFYLNFLKSLSIKKYKFHILRHTFASRSLLCGIDVKSLSEILGHSSVKTTLDLYVHVTDNEKLLQINKLTF